MLANLTRHSSKRHRTRGQTMVEFALIFPILVLLLLIAVDFGRVFLGWVSLNNAARVGANYAAANPQDTWGPGSDYQVLMNDNVGAINCTRAPTDPPTFGPTKAPGEIVTVDLTCSFPVITPLIGAFFPGGAVTVASSAAFPITFGCLVDCSPGTGGPPPPAPTDGCRVVPDVRGLSVAGARAAWINAGFSTFQPAPGADDTRTVENQTVTEPSNTEGCTGTERFFQATMTVTLAPLGPETSPTCEFVPNLRGVTVATARQTWTAAGFTGEFLPIASNDRIVIDQVSDPASSPGDCIEPTATVTVSHGPPPAPPPPAPCKVPSFINTSSSGATTVWTNAGSDPDNINFSQKNNTFTVRSQSLVGGTWVTCEATILLSHQGGQP
jgi:Flp pilus assembly protein TadG